MDRDDDLSVICVVATNSSPVFSHDSKDGSTLRFTIQRAGHGDDASFRCNVESSVIAGAHKEEEHFSVFPVISICNLDNADTSANWGRLGDGELENRLDEFREELVATGNVYVDDG